MSERRPVIIRRDEWGWWRYDVVHAQPGKPAMRSTGEERTWSKALAEGLAELAWMSGGPHSA